MSFLSSSNFKNHACESGKAVGEVARFNQWFNDEEKRLLSTGNDDIKVGVIRHELEEERP